MEEQEKKNEQEQPESEEVKDLDVPSEEAENVGGGWGRGWRRDTES